MGNKCGRSCGATKIEEPVIEAVKEITKIRGIDHHEKRAILKIQAHFRRCDIIRRLYAKIDKKRRDLQVLYSNKLVSYDEFLHHQHPNVSRIEEILPPLKQEDKNVSKYCFDIEDYPIKTNEDGPVTLYKGTWNLNGQYHGNGALVKADGSKYEGYWVSGLMNRNGRFILTNGDYFEGNFKMGEPSGNGVFVQSDGTRYEGNWENNFQHGYGEEYYPDGASYKGDYMYGKKTGIGRFDWEDGSYYEGEISNGKMHGKGIYQYSDGRVYNGDWSENKFNGTGVLTFPDGKRYEGEFKDDNRHGFGKFIWNRKKYYEGEWSKGKQHGNGVLFYDGRQIKGTWKNGEVGRIQHPKNQDK
jgi:hypothetical protein